MVIVALILTIKYRITEQLSLEGLSEDHLVSTLFAKQGEVQQVAQGHLRFHFEYLHLWAICFNI